MTRVQVIGLTLAVLVAALMGWHFGALQGALAVVAAAAAAWRLGALRPGEPDGRLVVRFGDETGVDVDTATLKAKAWRRGGRLNLTGWTDDGGQHHSLHVEDGDGRPLTLSFELPRELRKGAEA